MSQPMGSTLASRHVTNQTPPPGSIPPLVHCGDEGAQRRKWLLGSSFESLSQEDDIIRKGLGREEGDFANDRLSVFSESLMSFSISFLLQLSSFFSSPPSSAHLPLGIFSLKSSRPTDAQQLLMTADTHTHTHAHAVSMSSSPHTTDREAPPPCFRRMREFQQVAVMQGNTNQSANQQQPGHSTCSIISRLIG